jgi:hypothetical protein
MGDFVKMQVLQNLNDFSDVEDFDLMSKFVIVIFDELGEASAFAVLHDEIQGLGLLESKLELNDSWVFDFCE